MNKSIYSNVAQPMIQLLLKRSAVLTDQLRGVAFSAKDKQFRYIEQPPTQVDCLIIGKEHYIETNQSYPMQSKAELQKVLGLEAMASSGLLQYVIGPYVDGKRMVTKWQIDLTVLENHQLKPWFIIPESAGLLESDSNELITIERGQRTFWFTVRNGEWVSAERKGIISSEMMFRASAGLAEGITTKTLTEQSYLDLVYGRCGSLLLTQTRGLATGLRKAADIDWMNHFKFSGTAAAVLVSAYFALTSFYLYSRHELAQSATSELREQTKDIFVLKRQLNDKQTQYNDLAEVVAQHNASGVVWRLLGPLAKDGAEVQQLSMAPNGEYTVRISADSATEVLNFFSSDDQVINPRFRGQNTRVKEKDRFAIVFNLKEQDQ